MNPLLDRSNSHGSIPGLEIEEKFKNNDTYKDITKAFKVDVK